MDKVLETLYSQPFPSTRTGALFNAFSYPTKISPEAIAIFIACHTKPGETILDPFGGSGTTGIAVKLCDAPTASMIEYAQEKNLSPTWGPRHAIVYELSPAGCLAGKVMCSGKAKEFKDSAIRLLQRAKEQCSHLYTVLDPSGHEGEIRHMIWSDSVICPHCGKESLYGEIAVTLHPVTFHEKALCPFCAHEITVSDAERAHSRYQDYILNKKIETKKRKPFWVYGKTGQNKWSRKATADDLKRYSILKGYQLDKQVSPCPISWGLLYRRGYHIGISHLHHFYTERNFHVFNTLWRLVEDFPESVQESLRVWLLSYNTAHSTLMTRVVAKKDSKDFVITGAQPGVLYISGLPVEKNLLLGLERKIGTFCDAFSIVERSKSTVVFRNQSSTNLLEKDNTVDYVFTDPPFGDYIPYSELNQLNEAWLGTLTDAQEEVIINDAQGKSLKTYQALMSSVFSEIHRVLCPNALCTVVFHSAKSEIWRSIISSYTSAGFTVQKTSILNKKQASFKQTNSTITVKGDPLLLLINANNNPVQNKSMLSDTDVAKHLIDSRRAEPNSKEKSEQLFSSYITTCIEHGIKITLDAQYFFNAGNEEK